MKTLLILGASGAVGSQLLAQALRHPDVAKVVAPTRRPLNPHPKLENPIVDFEALPADASWWQADVTFCALGTTLKQAGSAQAFYRVDHDYILHIAELTHAAGTQSFVLNSTLGADVNGFGLYLKTKGETERDVGSLGFSSLSIVRPSLLDGAVRTDKRTGEAVGLLLNRCLRKLIPITWRAISVAKVAQMMLSAGLSANPGIRVIESAEIHQSDE
ncbi:NAD-dependent dehydratase [Rheinheimera riviphila]|uniref:NAD-dependent dehydratase n=1 Tax=Rheinheimera riviphila TaxID=1834037 RepID=A0A437QIP8_9GAMM|nr:NAD(P)H-binding protein [Rheinheimera riviphila]RVU34422.1 NAD-dependent dehydratase [Rheinheimera riviphila]